MVHPVFRWVVLRIISSGDYFERAFWVLKLLPGLLQLCLSFTGLQSSTTLLNLLQFS